jgi:hypothetical protein
MRSAIQRDSRPPRVVLAVFETVCLVSFAGAGIVILPIIELLILHVRSGS